MPLIKCECGAQNPESVAICPQCARPVHRVGPMAATAGTASRPASAPRFEPGRNARTHEERVEWQLNQIRVNTLIVALFFALVLIGSLIIALTHHTTTTSGY